ncbi:MAG: efflux RND transporter periplasmic adaptor subunit [Candidatus Moraniibacteriota bacterium]|nr:MAG: efflux RND transporter periplasmic adaptor subunit [Candidatus Moranbacteria bacterium]
MAILNYLKEHAWYLFLLLLVCSGAGYYGYYQEGTTSQTQESNIEYASATKGNIQVEVTATGQVYAKEQVSLKPQIAGDGLEIMDILVEDGQEVKKDDVIAVLDNEEAYDAIRDAKLSLKSAKIKMDQTRDLYIDKTVDDRRLRQLQELTYKESKNRVSDSEKELEKYFIKAPFDGIVTDFKMEKGDSISRDEILASIISKKMYAEVSINEVDAVKLKKGNPARLTFDALPGVSVEGTVSKVDTIGTVEQNVVYFKAEIEFSDIPKELKSGMSVSVAITTESKENVLSIPLSALKGNSSEAFVWKEKKNSDLGYEKVPIVSGISNDISVEIVSGILEGDRVVTKITEPTTTKETSSPSGILNGAIRIPGSGGAPPGGMNR